jgi:hypothetical protein
MSASRFPCAPPDPPIVSAGSSKTDQPRPLLKAHFMPRILREAMAVTSHITPSLAPLKRHFVPRILREDMALAPRTTPSHAPVAASITRAVTAAPVAGSICPTCQCRVPARLSAAARQRAYRARKREQGQGLQKANS